MSTATPRPDLEPSAQEALQTDRADAVRLTDLHKSFGDVTAVDGIDLTIRPGEVVALLGPNGAGKTTTIDMILGLSRPHQRRCESLRDDSAPGGRPGSGRRSHADRRPPARYHRA